MRNQYLWTTLFLLFSCVNAVFAQELSADLKKRAKDFYLVNKYKEAQSVLLQIKKNRQDDKETKLLLALSTYHLNQLKDAEPLLKSILEAEKSPFPETWLYLGKVYHDRHEFNKANEYYKLYLKAIPADHNNRMAVRDDIRRAAQGIKLQYRQPKAIVENLGPRINTAYDEFGPLTSPNFGDRLYFSSVRPGNAGGSRNNFGQIDEVMGRNSSDIFTSQLSGGAWSLPQPMHYLLNSPKHEVILDFNPSGKALIYFKGSSYTQGEILVDTIKAGSRTLTSDPFLGPVDALAGLSSAHFVADTLVIFSSQRPGGFGGLDLYKTVFKAGRWTSPQNMGPDINTPFDETTPFIARDGRTLYFSSNQPNGSMGGFDVFRTQFYPTLNRWLAPDNLGVPVNSAADDTHFRLSRDGYTAYFASTRKDGYGERDIYAAYFFDYLHEMTAPVYNSAPITATTAGGGDLAIRGQVLNLKPLFFNQDGQWASGKEQDQLMDMVKILKQYPQLTLCITGTSRQELATTSRMYSGLKSVEFLAKHLVSLGMPAGSIQLRGVPPPADFTNFKAVHFQVSGLGELPLKVNAENWLGKESNEKGLYFRLQIAQAAGLFQHPLLSKDPEAGVERSFSNGTYLYTLGKYSTYADAKTAQERMAAQLSAGGSEIIPYYNGQRLNRENAGPLSGQYPDLLSWLEKK
jgi:hypothetical protein